MRNGNKYLTKEAISYRTNLPHNSHKTSILPFEDNQEHAVVSDSQKINLMLIHNNMQPTA